jgi:hypothetical protein
MDFHNMRYPRDLVALQAGHLMDFYRGSARDLRDRIARALPHWSADVPGYHAVLGMHAFGLEETGDYARAEEVGRRAIDLEPLDCWAHHAVAHVMEMQGRAEDGIGWMIAREPHWAGDDNFFKVHNWWHRALCHLDLGQIDEVWRSTTGRSAAAAAGRARPGRRLGAALARAPLGHDVGDRWAELADAWDAHADGRLYPFNDWHAVMAYLGAGRHGTSRASAGAGARAGAATDTAGGSAPSAGRSSPASWRSRAATTADAVEALHPVRFVANQFGGSHAQRDVIDWTLTEAAVRAGLRDVALALAARAPRAEAAQPGEPRLPSAAPVLW